MTDEQRLEETAAFSADGTHDARVAALRRLPVRQRVLLAADWAALVLPIWERAYPGDNRPRRAIEAARKGDGKASAAAAYAAAAYAAAAAAAAAASAAAYAAAYAAAAASAAAAAYAAAAAAAAAADAGSTWDGVRRLWDAAHHAGNAWRSEWHTPLAIELARDPAAYQVLLDLLADEGVPVEGLRAARWARSNWAIYHLTEGK